MILRDFVQSPKWLIFVLVPIAISCGPAPSQLKTVDLPQTPPKNQGNVGFCWAYATIGFVESQSLVQTGKTFDLSEEALGFYRIAEELSYLSQHYTATELGSSKQVKELGVEEITGSDFLFHNHQKAYGRFPAAFELVQKYGVVPESVWSIKFDKSTPGNEAIDAIIERFVDYKTAHAEADCCDVPTLVSHVMTVPVGEVGFKSAPPTSFEYDGKTTTAIEFLQQNFHLNSAASYDVVTATSIADYSTFVQRTKVALDAGQPVPVEFAADPKFLDFKTATFTGEYNAETVAEMGMDPADHSFSLGGGHVVLITDYVNVGGKAGLVTPAEKKAALDASPGDLDYFVVKNSWRGIDATLPGVPAQFYLIKKKYLELNMGAHTPGQVSTLFVAVPKVL